MFTYVWMVAIVHSIYHVVELGN